MKLLAIGIFGILGVYSRYLIDKLPLFKTETFPFSTLAINLLGCFLIGFLYTYNLKIKSDILYPAMIIGFCGGLTTFSTYSLQILDLIFKGNQLKGLVYLMASPILGVLMVLIGMSLAKTYFRIA